MLKHVVRGILVGSVAVALVASVAFAKDEKKAAVPEMDAQTKAMMEEMAKYASPGPEHKVMEPLIGKWKTSVKTWMGPGEPTLSTGTAEYAWTMGGRFVDYTSKGLMWGQPFEGREILGYDRMIKTYSAVWMDNTGTGIYTITSGSYDEATKTFTFNAEWPNPMDGKKVPYKMTTKVNGPDSHVFTMYQAAQGGDQKMMEIDYTRVK